MNEMALQDKFDAQLRKLVSRGYPALTSMSEKQFKDIAEPLRNKLSNIQTENDSDMFSFLIVVKKELISPEDAMRQVVINQRTGFVKMYPKEPVDFQEIATINLPDTPMYLLLDVDTGRQFLNISPEDSLKTIVRQGRTPLTLEEGVALVTQYPEVLTDRDRYNCIQMPGSRIVDDQRVPSIWMSDKTPRLGWCWNRNIHTWLGSASASQRLG